MIANVLLALLAEPQSMLAFLLLTFAAGMYPVGMFFGSVCGGCCGCVACAEGTLPDTITVAISGYVDEQVEGPDLAFLSFSSNYGSLAEGKVTAPGGDPATDKGPISAVSVTGGGSGYAVLGRVAPTLTISGYPYGSGTGATFTPTLNNTQDAGNNNFDLWSLASVAVSGGTGYADFEPLTITVADGDTQVSLASAITFVDKSPPTLTLSGTATATIVLSGVSIFLDYPYYTVGSVAVTNGGSGYTNGQALTFSAGAGDVTLVNATATAVVISGDQLHSVTITNPGNYYHADPGGISVVVKDGGSYYREDASVTPYLATVTVGVTQSAPSTGSGAVLAAIIDDDTGSASFGFITGVTITNGGDGYLAWANRVAVCCEDYWNGMSVVLKRRSDNPCSYSHAMCGTSCVTNIFVTYLGPSQPPTIHLSASECGYFLESSTLVAACDDLSFTATHASGATFTVTPGGEYVESFKAGDGSQNCFPCCRGDSPAPVYVEVDLYSYDTFYAVIVLGRGDSAGGGGGCGPFWQGATSGPQVQIIISQCNDPNLPDCDHCWKKCQTTAFIDANPGGQTSIFGSAPCIACADSPVCAPAAGSYDCYDLDGRPPEVPPPWTVIVP